MDPFATLGLPRRFALDRGELEARYRELQRALHPDRHVDEPPAQRRIALQRAVEVNEAYRLLKDDLRRAESLLTAVPAASTGTPASGHDGSSDPAFLMEMLELREALSEAKHRRDLGKVRAMAVRVRADAERVLGALSTGLEAFCSGSERAAPTQEARAALFGQLGRLKYYRRFLDEVAVVEDEAGD